MKHVVTPYTAKSFLIVVYFLIVEYQGNALGCGVVVSKSCNISGGEKVLKVVVVDVWNI